jgi:hypothetical protein
MDISHATKPFGSWKNCDLWSRTALKLRGDRPSTDLTRNPTMYALWIAFKTAPEKLDYCQEWPDIQHLSCKLFGHSVFDEETFERLKAWLKAEHKSPKTPRDSPMEEVVRTKLPEVVALLRAGVDAAALAPSATVSSATSTSGRHDRVPQDQADGPFDVDGFRYRNAEVRFGRAAKQKALVLALWDEEGRRPRRARPIENVLTEVYGDDHDTGDAAFRQLCSDTRGRFARFAVALTIEITQGHVQLTSLPL